MGDQESISDFGVGCYRFGWLAWAISYMHILALASGLGFGSSGLGYTYTYTVRRAFDLMWGMVSYSDKLEIGKNDKFFYRILC